MEIYAVAVSAVDLRRAVAFYELLGFAFTPAEEGDQHLEAVVGPVRLMIDDAALLEQLHGEPPRPGTASGFARRIASPSPDHEGRSASAALNASEDRGWGRATRSSCLSCGYRTPSCRGRPSGRRAGPHPAAPDGCTARSRSTRSPARTRGSPAP